MSIINAKSIPSLDAFIVGLLLIGRIAFLLASPTGLSGDAQNYLSAAETIISTGRLPALYVQPRGFPLLISPLLLVAGNQIADAVLLMNVLMDTAVIAVLILLAWRLFSGPRQRMVRFFACAAVIFQPFTAEMVSSLYTEQASQFFVFFGICALVRFRSTADVPSTPVVGPLLLGIASLLRTDLLPLNLAVLLLFFGLRSTTFDRFFRKAALGAALYALCPLSMLAFQYHSTGEIGFARIEQPRSGYMAWMRTWFALEKVEYDRLAFDVGTMGWPGFDTANYPGRAFESASERQQVAEILSNWRADGYTESVERAFRALANQRLRERPFHCYIVVPVARMLHFWINIDGAQTILRTVSIARPFSTVVVGLTILLKLGFFFLALIGTYSAWRTRTGSATYGTQLEFARLSSITVLLRTLELGVLGIFLIGGLMEVRYILVVFPFLIVLSLFGLQFIVCTGLFNNLVKRAG